MNGLKLFGLSSDRLIIFYTKGRESDDHRLGRLCDTLCADYLAGASYVITEEIRMGIGISLSIATFEV